MRVRIYVEGGGEHNKNLQTQCRRGFSKFFEKAGLKDRMPSVVACGGRRRAYDSFRMSHENAGADNLPILLVDSEGPVTGKDPWEHVKLRKDDGWECPVDASRDQLHLMVQAMEAWFHADKEVLRQYYGPAFRPAALSQRLIIDDIPKTDLFDGLLRATNACATKGKYSKAQHSFEILALIDPAKVKGASPVHAARLLNLLDRVCAR